MKNQKANHSRKPKTLRPGEFISRTQKPIRNIDTNILEIRIHGISVTRKALTLVPYESASNEEAFDACRAVARDIIASMNYSIQDCVKELKSRNVKP